MMMEPVLVQAAAECVRREHVRRDAATAGAGHQFQI